MKKGYFRFFIIIATFSLVGVIFTQLYWVKKAVHFKEEQFNQGIKIAMKCVVNQLLDSYNDSTIKKMKKEGSGCQILRANIHDVVDEKQLTSLVEKELGCMRINIDYVYGIYSNQTERFFMGVYKDNKKELISSSHQVSLGCLCKRGGCYLSIYFPNQKSRILYKMLGWLVLSALFIIVVIISFYFTISTLMRQKKLSEMKTDFVNNMTHEFKTPISTISLASEMLLQPKIFESPDKTKKYAKIIYDENIRLQNQVEQVLQISILDKGDMKIKPKEINLHKLVQKLAVNFKLGLKESNGKLELSLNATEPVIHADRVHLVNIISNLLDNAKKYSNDSPHIKLITENYLKGVIVIVEDNGIGISTEHQKQIFKKLYRVPTGNIHDVKGFGIGLYYVKTMVEVHGGNIEVDSEQGRGSSFKLYLPFKTNIENEKG
jgi:two-component system phosphate regulon sensor histidine kinase PhoR